MAVTNKNMVFTLLVYVSQIWSIAASDANHYNYVKDNNDNLKSCLLSSSPSLRTIYPCSTPSNQNSSQYQCDHFDVNKLSAVSGGRIPHSPAVIVNVTDSSDVQKVVKCAVKLNYIVNALGGGHSYEGYGLGSAANNIVINMEAINYININQYDGTGTVGAGARLGPVYYRTYQYNYTVNGGSCAWIGIAGHALGGGQGYLSRLYGLLTDSILEMRAVNDQGDLLTINKTHEPELYWALRGAGGGMFVIVTEFKFRLVKPPSLVQKFIATWNSNATKSVIQRHQKLLFDDDILNSSNTLALYMGVQKSKVEVTILCFGTESEQLNRTISVLLAGPPAPDSNYLYQQDWLTFVYESSGILNMSGDPRELLLNGLTYPTYRYKAKDAFFNKPISTHGLDQLIARLASSEGQLGMGFNPWDGYLSTIPVDETAFPHRNVKFGIQFGLVPDNEQVEEQQIYWLNQVYLAIYNDSTKHAYVNYIDRDMPNWMDAYYGTHQQRLIRVKQNYDKDNRFYFERTIVGSNGVSRCVFLNAYLACIVTVLLFIA